MRRTLFIALLTLMILPYGAASAFPGDERDESCEAIIAQVGEDAADCLVNPGLSAIELRAAEIEATYSPLPAVAQVQMIEDVVHARRFRRVTAGTSVYDAPNGNVIRQFGEGLHLVTYIGWIEGWVQLRQNEWVPDEATRIFEPSTFAGVEINAPLERPFAWMLVPVKPSLYPGGPPNEAYAEIPRYQLMNIYGVELVDSWEWYMIAPDQWVHQIRVSKVKPVARPADVQPTDKWIAVDLFEQTAVAYQGDQMVFATLISSGLPQWSTEEGLFQMYQRWVNGPMSGATGYLGDAYYIENIANIMYFNGDMALHAAYWHDKFGYRQSRGCVNLSLMDAHWIYEFTRDDEDAWVYVYSSGEYRDDLPDWAIRPRS
jgi:L,D-transpeptidase catalytic domain